MANWIVALRHVETGKIVTREVTQSQFDRLRRNEFVAGISPMLEYEDFDESPGFIDWDDPLDGDIESGLASCGWGTDDFGGDEW